VNIGGNPSVKEAWRIQSVNATSANASAEVRKPSVFRGPVLSFDANKFSSS
jgi:hypothetical protein